MNTISVALVDDHPLMIEGLAQMLSRSPNFKVLAMGCCAKDITAISARYQPDVIIIDLSMIGDVYQAIAAALSIAPRMKIVAFTAATGVDSAIRALDAGAHGYVLKGSSAQELIHAVETVRLGESYITQSLGSQVITALRDTSLRRQAAQVVNLSIRENQIVSLLLRGKTNKEIAAALKISDKTVKHYMTILMQKLHARNRLEVIIAAQKISEDEPVRTLQ